MKKSKFSLMLFMVAISISALVFGVYSLSKYHFNASGTITYENTAATMIDVACTISGSDKDTTVYATTFVGNSSRPNYNVSNGAGGYQLAENVQALTDGTSSINLGTLSFGADSTKIRLVFDVTNYNVANQYATTFSLPTISAYYTESGVSYINTYSETNDSTGETTLDIVKKDDVSTFSNLSVTVNLEKLASTFSIETTSPTSATEPALHTSGYATAVESDQFATTSTITYNNIIFTCTDDGTNKTATVKEANTDITTLFIPNSIAGYKVTGGTSISFSNPFRCPNLKSVVVPVDFSYNNSIFYSCSAITSIKCMSDTTEGLFYNGELMLTSNPTSGWWNASGKQGLLNLLNKVTFTGEITSIGDSAFSDANMALILNNYRALLLKSISLPASVTSLGRACFYGSGLESVNIPSTVETIGIVAFASCTNLKSAQISSKIIYNQAFEGCTSLNTLTVSDTVEYVYQSVFSNLTGLTKINWNTSIGYVSHNGTGGSSQSDAIFSNAGSSTSGVEIVFGNNVTQIPYGLFTTYNTAAGSTSTNNITKITIGNSVTAIGKNAFAGLTNVTTLNYNATNCTSTFGTELNAFDNMGTAGAGVTLTIGNNVTTIPANFMQNTTMPNITSLTIGTVVESIGTYAFYNCVGINAISIPNSVVTLGESAFDSCSGAKTLSIGTGLEEISGYAFTLCGFESINIPNNIKIIGDNAFSACSSVKTLTIGTGVESIGASAFDGLTHVTTFNYNATNCTSTFADNYIFNDMGTAGTGVTLAIGNNVTTIPANFMQNTTMPNITTLTIGEGVTTIGSNALANLTKVETLNYNATNCTSSFARPLLNGYGTFESVGIDTSEGFILNVGNNVSAIPKDFMGGLFVKTAPKVKTANLGSVNTIGDSAFYQITSMTELNLSENLITINGFAFNLCSGLTSITIPSSVESIGTMAFSGCNGLTSINVESGNTVYDSRNNCNAIIERNTNKLIKGCNTTVVPNDIESIEGYAFFKCYNLTTVAIPDGVTSIGMNAFANCSGLNSITIPDSVQTIGSFAFNGCTGATTLTIGAGVTSMGQGAFADATGLTTINYKAQNCADIAEDSPVFTNVGTATSGTSIIIDTLAYNIPANLFNAAGDVISITIGDGVLSIGQYAFAELTGVTEINYYAVGCADLLSTDEPFKDVGYNAAINIGNGSGNANLNVPAYLFYTSEFPVVCSTLNITSDVATIGEKAFANMKYVTEVFYGATNITESFADKNVFDALGTALTDDDQVVFTIADNVTTIPANFMTNTTMPKITTLYIGQNVSTINNQAFSGLTKLQNIEYAAKNAQLDMTNHPTDANVDDYTNIDWGMFNNCGTDPDSSGISLVIKPTVESIPNYMFYHAYGNNNYGYDETSYIAKIIGVDCQSTNLTSIGTQSFCYNTINSFTFSNASTYNDITIGEYAFYKTSINSFDFSRVISIGKYAFYDCSSLSSIIISNKVQTIGQNAFSNCNNATTLSLGNGISSIETYVFLNCLKINAISIPGNVKTIGASAFSDCSGATTLTIGEGVQTIGAAAFSGCKSLTSITIPASVNLINTNPFSSCSGLTSISVASGNSKYNSTGSCNAIIETSTNKLILGCKNTNIPSSVINIGNNAFYNCTGLTSISLPSNLTTIGSNAFYNCTGLTSISLPSNLTTIGSYAFYGCSALNSVYIDNSTIANSLTSKTAKGYIINYLKSSTGKLYIKSTITITTSPYVTNTSNFTKGSSQETVGGVKYNVYTKK